MRNSAPNYSLLYLPRFLFVFQWFHKRIQSERPTLRCYYYYNPCCSAQYLEKQLYFTKRKQNHTKIHNVNDPTHSINTNPSETVVAEDPLLTLCGTAERGHPLSNCTHRLWRSHKLDSFMM